MLEIVYFAVYCCILFGNGYCMLLMQLQICLPLPHPLSPSPLPRMTTHHYLMLIILLLEARRDSFVSA